MKLITVEEVAAKLHVKPCWVRDRTRKSCPVEQQVPHIRLPGCRYVRFNEDEVDRWIANGCKPVNSPKNRTFKNQMIGET